jgi:hypothetical protein
LAAIFKTDHAVKLTNHCHVHGSDAHGDHGLEARTLMAADPLGAGSTLATAAKVGRPVFTVTPGKPDRGTLFDVGFDFREVGLLAGRLAGDLLHGTDPATVPIGETAREILPRLTINLAAPGYDRSRWRVPDELLRQAKIVIDTGSRRDQPEAMLAGPFTEAEAP